MKLPARLSLERVVYDLEPADLEALRGEATHLLGSGLRLVGASGESLYISWTEAADTFKLYLADQHSPGEFLVETDMTSSSMWELVVGGPVEIRWDDDDERVVSVRNSEDCVYCCVYDQDDVVVTRARPDMDGCPPTREPPPAARASLPKARLGRLDASASRSGLLDSIVDSSDTVAATLLVGTLLACLLAAPIVWWFYGPLWAIGAAIASPILFALTPFNGFKEMVVVVNLLYCALVAVRLLFL